MVLAIKSNKVLVISEEEVQSYQALGFDIVDEENGKRTVRKYGHGKTVSYTKYAEALEKIERLEAEINALKAKEKPAAKKK